MATTAGRYPFDVNKMRLEQRPWKLVSEFIADVQDNREFHLYIQKQLTTGVRIT